MGLISRIGVGGSYTARVYGRQSIALDGYGEYRHYDQLATSNHAAYGLRANGCGKLGQPACRHRRLAPHRRLAETSPNRARHQGLITADRLDATGAYRFGPIGASPAGSAASRVEHDGREASTRRGPRHARRHRLRHRRSATPSASSCVTPRATRRSTARLDRAAFPDNEYEENEWSLVTLAYGLGATLRLRGTARVHRAHLHRSPGEQFQRHHRPRRVDWRPGSRPAHVRGLPGGPARSSTSTRCTSTERGCRFRAFAGRRPSSWCSPRAA